MSEKGIIGLVVGFMLLGLGMSLIFNAEYITTSYWSIVIGLLGLLFIAIAVFFTKTFCENNDLLPKPEYTAYPGVNRCPFCGKSAPADAVYCPYCGEKIEDTSYRSYDA